jgi:CHAD domain-containing protein
MRRIQFAIKHNIGTKHIFELLAKEYPRNEKHQVRIHRQYLDSFDWRMHQNSYICGTDDNDAVKSFFLEESETGECVYTLPLSEAPRFSQDIPHAKCRRILEGILEIRALIGVASVNIRQRQLLILDNQHKTLIRLHVESYTIPGRTGLQAIPGRLMVFPVRGYKKVLHGVVQYISEQLRLSPVETNLLDEILAVIGKVPVPAVLDETKKLSGSLNTWQAAQILFSDLLNVMQANEQGLRDAIDTEFLHDYRVALRRTRSLLTQIKHLFPSKELEYFKQEFYWLGLITSPTRDLDVYLLKFDNYAKVLPEALRDDLVPFRQFLRRHWKTEHTRLCEALNSKRYRKLIREWKRILQRRSIQSLQTFNAKNPAKQVANQRILKLYRKVLKEGGAIAPESPDEDLHELRKTCKKFRYLMEFFQSYYPSDQIKRLIKSLKLLQDNLGDFQDLCVQTQQLSDFAQQMQDEGLADTKTIMAMGVLVQNLVTRKETVRRHFSERFKEFSSAERVMEFKTAFSCANTLEGAPA